MDYLNKSYIPAFSGEEVSLGDMGIGLWLVVIRFKGNNNVHRSVYIYSSDSVYAKNITPIYTYNYNNNTSIEVKPNASGVSGFTIKATYSNLSADVSVNMYKMASY